MDDDYFDIVNEYLDWENEWCPECGAEVEVSEWDEEDVYVCLYCEWNSSGDLEFYA